MFLFSAVPSALFEALVPLRLPGLGGGGACFCWTPACKDWKSGSAAVKIWIQAGSWGGRSYGKNTHFHDAFEGNLRKRLCRRPVGGKHQSTGICWRLGILCRLYHRGDQLQSPVRPPC